MGRIEFQGAGISANGNAITDCYSFCVILDIALCRNPQAQFMRVHTSELIKLKFLNLLYN